MNIITIAAVAIVSAISAVAIKKHNGEISLMLSIACGVILLTAVISFAATILQTVNKIAAASDMNIEYIKNIAQGNRNMHCNRACRQCM